MKLFHLPSIFLITSALVSCRPESRLPNRLSLFNKRTPVKDSTAPMDSPENGVDTITPTGQSFVQSDQPQGSNSRFQTILEGVRKSPKVQDFVLTTADKLLSFLLFAATLRLVSRALNVSWSEFKSQWGSMKDGYPKHNTNFTGNAYVKPNVTLNSYEEDILTNIISPESVSNSLDDIGGIESIKDTVIDLLQPPGLGHRGLPLGDLAQPTRSLLLYGPPGCGKSMLARALCKKLKIPMISVTPSLLLRMYVGETPRLTKALFTLALKLQPCLIFIDEADSLFCARSGADHAVDRKIMTEFMQLWDDLLRDKAEVLLIAATNRPQDLDPAIQRRFERAFLIPAPNLAARREVFAKVLRGVQLDADFDLPRCAQLSEGYTSSDIAQVCKAAVRHCLRSSAVPRPLTTEDVVEALKTVYPTAWAAQDFERSASRHEYTHDHASTSSAFGGYDAQAGYDGSTNNGMGGANAGYGEDGEWNYDGTDDGDEDNEEE